MVAYRSVERYHSAMFTEPDIRLSPLGPLCELVPESTPDLILRAAGSLFATKGFHGTATREIAEAIGIRKPSLFHHFPSKIAMAQHLFEYDRLRSPHLLGRMELPLERPAVRLYQSLRREVMVEATSRYELRGLYLSDLLDEPEFAFWKTEYERAAALEREVIIEGIRQGEFIDEQVVLVGQLFDAMLNWVVRLRKKTPCRIDADSVASLLLRCILARPEDIVEIRASADRALASVEPPGDAPDPIGSDAA